MTFEQMVELVKEQKHLAEMAKINKEIKELTDDRARDKREA